MILNMVRAFIIRFPSWQPLYFRFRCPAPIGHAKSARACFNAGECGCNNADRFK